MITLPIKQKVKPDFNPMVISLQSSLSEMKVVVSEDLKELIGEMDKSTSYSYVYTRLNQILNGTRWEYALKYLESGRLSEKKLQQFVVDLYLSTVNLSIPKKLRQNGRAYSSRN